MTTAKITRILARLRKFESAATDDTAESALYTKVCRGDIAKTAAERGMQIGRAHV